MSGKHTLWTPLIVKIRERLLLMRGNNAKDDSEKFELKNLRNDELRQEYQIKISKYGRGTERHLPRTDESVIQPAGERR